MPTPEHIIPTFVWLTSAIDKKPLILGIQHIVSVYEGTLNETNISGTIISMTNTAGDDQGFVVMEKFEEVWDLVNNQS